MDHQRAIQNLAVESYLLDEMTPGERESFEEHFFDCQVCAADVREALQLMEQAPRVLKLDISAPVGAVRDRPALREAPRETKGKWFSWLQPQAAGAALAMLAAVCLIETIAIPNLWHRLEEASAPRVVASAFLKPQTRGTPTILKVAAGQPVIVMFDPPETTASPLEYVLQSTNGSVQFQLSSDAPAAGEPVTLSLPKLDAPAGSYMLIVKAPAADGHEARELGRYPFELQR